MFEHRLTLVAMKDNFLLDVKIINQITKALAYLAIFSYYMRFIVHNIYLSGFGFSDFTFLQIFFEKIKSLLIKSDLEITSYRIR